MRHTHPRMLLCTLRRVIRTHSAPFQHGTARHRLRLPLRAALRPRTSASLFSTTSSTSASSLPPNTDAAALHDAITTDGFALVEGMCPPDMVSSVLYVARRRASEVFEELRRKGVDTEDIGIGSAAGYEEIVQRSPGRWDLPIEMEEFPPLRHGDEDAPWWPVVESLLGPDAESMFSGVVFSEPGRYRGDSCVCVCVCVCRVM